MCRCGEIVRELREGAILEGQLELRERHVRGEEDAPAHRAEDMCYAELDEDLRILGRAEIGYEEVGHDFSGGRRGGCDRQRDA